VFILSQISNKTQVSQESFGVWFFQGGPHNVNKLACYLMDIWILSITTAGTQGYGESLVKDSVRLGSHLITYNPERFSTRPANAQKTQIFVE
jgi:hypothetical protein